MDAHQFLIPLAAAFGVAALTTPLVMRLAVSIGITDQPSERSVNRRPDIPLMGGVAVGAGFAAGLALAIWQVGLSVPTGHLLALAGGGALVLASGVYDDRFGMNAWSKVAIQTIAAVFAISSGFQIDHLTEPFSRTSFQLPMWLSWVVSALWIVTVTNSLNLLGAVGNLLAIKSTVGGSAAFLDLQGTSSADFVFVEDNDATAGNPIPLGPNSMTGSNTPGWLMVALVPALGALGLALLVLSLLSSGPRVMARLRGRVAAP